MVSYITKDNLLKEFKFAVSEIVEAKIGSRAKDIGTHSVRFRAVMAMFKDNVPILFIMLVGICYSDAFLNYTRKQGMVFIKVLSSITIRK